MNVSNRQDKMTWTNIYFPGLAALEKEHFWVGYHEVGGRGKLPDRLGGYDAIILRQFVEGRSQTVPDLPPYELGRYIASIQIAKWREQLLEEFEFTLHGAEPNSCDAYDE